MKAFPVQTDEIQVSILQICAERKDEWAQSVKCRIEYVQSLHASGVVYHQACSANLELGSEFRSPSNYEYMKITVL